jgi:hypothetical protein
MFNQVEIIMRQLFLILLATLFAVVTFSAFAIDQGTQGNPPAPQKHTKKKKKSHPLTVQQSGNPMDKSGQGAS